MTDPNYCLLLINQPCAPLAWWASGAAWAQAALTVGTFAATVLYQVLESRKAKAERKSAERSIARLIVGRELRRWRERINAFNNQSYQDLQTESVALSNLADELKWSGEIKDVILLGHLSEGISILIHNVDELAAISKEINAYVLNEDQEHRRQFDKVKNHLKSIESKIVQILNAL